MNILFKETVGETPHLTPEQLISIRKGFELSQSELGALLDVSRFTISKMERGIYPISRRIDLSIAYLSKVWDFYSSISGLSAPKTSNNPALAPTQNKPKSNKKKKKHR